MKENFEKKLFILKTLCEKFFCKFFFYIGIISYEIYT